jgi:hypothetical protein
MEVKLKKKTLQVSIEKRIGGIPNHIDKLIENGMCAIEQCLLPIPETNVTNVFYRKHVFEAFVTQQFSPDPMFVGAKGALNFARQLGFRCLPCFAIKAYLESSSYCLDHSQ